MKEALRTWYATATKASAAQGLDGWIARVKRQGPAELKKALSAFRNWRDEILAFFDFLPTRLSNGFVEGKNNRTKALMRQGYGYRNRRHLRVQLRDRTASAEAIAFDKATAAPHLPSGRRIDVVYALQCERWDGLDRIRLHLRDLRPAVQPALALAAL